MIAQGEEAEAAPEQAAEAQPEQAPDQAAAAPQAQAESVAAGKKVRAPLQAWPETVSAKCICITTAEARGVALIVSRDDLKSGVHAGPGGRVHNRGRRQQARPGGKGGRRGRRGSSVSKNASYPAGKPVSMHALARREGWGGVLPYQPLLRPVRFRPLVTVAGPCACAVSAGTGCQRRPRMPGGARAKSARTCAPCVPVPAPQATTDPSPPPVQVRPRSRPSSPPTSASGTPKAGVRSGFSAAVRAQQGSAAAWSAYTLAGVLYIGECLNRRPAPHLLSA